MTSKKTYIVFGLAGPNGFKVAAFVPHGPADFAIVPIDAIMPVMIDATTGNQARKEWRNRRAEVQGAWKGLNA